MALAEFLPLDSQNWITKGNALRINWLSVCPPTGTGVKLQGDDLFSTPPKQAEIDFENEGGETYICGNPPYLGSTRQSKDQKADLENIFKDKSSSWKSLDYVSGWFMKAAEYGKFTNTSSAFVSTNSICQGQQVPILWPHIFKTGHEINFAHTSFKWANLASYNAGVTVAIISISNHPGSVRKLYTINEKGQSIVKEEKYINAYLVGNENVIPKKASKPINGCNLMEFGNKASDGGNLLLTGEELADLNLNKSDREKYIRKIYGAAEFIQGKLEYCIWLPKISLTEAMKISAFKERINKAREMRIKSSKTATKQKANTPHLFDEIKQTGEEITLIVPSVSSENRPYLPAGILDKKSLVKAPNFGIYDAPIWNLAIITSRIHLVWIANVCGQLETRLRYSNTLGWNTFPLPKLTAKNKEDLSHCAEEILIARERHFPATIADLYNPEKMPEDLRQAHERNDEVLERIYIGRRFKNDTERLEKLFELYTQMTSKEKAV